MCDEVILENDGTLMFDPECYKNKKCVIKLLIIIFMHYSLLLIVLRLTTYLSFLQYLSFLNAECYKTQEIAVG